MTPPCVARASTHDSVADILDAAATLLQPPGRWTQYYLARDGAARWVDSKDAAAVSWGALGAIERVTPDHIRRSALLAIKSLLGVRHLSRWNDDPKRTQAEVVAALRAAAEKARTVAETGAVGMSPKGE